MLPTDVLAYTRAVPFRPFRLVLNSGKSYDVRHPEMVRVTVSSVLYFYATDPEGPAERWETVSLPLLQSIEHIEALRQDKRDPPGWLGLGDSPPGRVGKTGHWRVSLGWCHRLECPRRSQGGQ